VRTVGSVHGDEGIRAMFFRLGKRRGYFTPSRGLHPGRLRRPPYQGPARQRPTVVRFGPGGFRREKVAREESLSTIPLNRFHATELSDSSLLKQQGPIFVELTLLRVLSAG
jgi:hypothetical protein